MIPLKLIDKNGTTFGVDRVENRQRVSTMPYQFEIAEGNIPKHKFISKFGHDSDAANSTIEVWTGSRVYPYMTTASVLYLSSSNTNDNQSYEIYGLDENWDEKIVAATANGFVSVALPGTWIRVFRVKNIGTTDNAGTIYISLDADAGGDGIPDTIATDSKAEVDVGMNQSLMAIWAVPRNHTAFLTNFYASASAATTKTVDISLWVRPFGSVFQVKKILAINSGQTSQIKYEFPLKIEAKSDVRITANASGAAEVSAGFDLLYKEL